MELPVNPTGDGFLDKLIKLVGEDPDTYMPLLLEPYAQTQLIKYDDKLTFDEKQQKADEVFEQLLEKYRDL